MNIKVKNYLYELRDILNSYKNGVINIGFFLRRSRSFIDLLGTVLEEKVDILHAAWFDIEQAYAVSLDRDEPISNYEKFVNEGIW